MLEVSRKPFKAIEFKGEDGNIRIEEEFTVGLVVEETGEVFSGVVTKIGGKELQLRQADENFERVFAFEDLKEIVRK
jgi:hypothetical protein